MIFSTRLAFCFSIFLLFFNTSHAQYLAQISSTATVVSNDVAHDASGNAYSTGGFIGEADFRDTVGSFFSISSLGLKDIFIAKYDVQGRPAWGFSIGGIAGGPGIDDEGTAIAVSPAGHIFVTGYFQGTADFDPGAGTAELTSQGFRDVFLASYTSDGEFRWAQSFGGSADDRGQDVTISGNEAVYFTGLFRETAQLSSDSNGSNTATSGGEEDGYLLAMDQNAGFNWLFSYGGVSIDKGNQVGTDEAGNVYLLGVFSRNAEFDPGSGSTMFSSLAGSQDGVLATYTPSGDLRWAIPIGGGQLDGTNGLAVDPAGNTFITGHFLGIVDFNPTGSPQEIVSTGRDLYIASYNPTGGLSWIHPMGSGFAEGIDIARNNAGNILVTGFFNDNIFPNPASTEQLTSNGEQDILLASYQPDGTFRWAQAIGGTFSEVPSGVSLSDSDDTFLTGHFEDGVDFNTGSGTLLAFSAGSFDGFLVRYGPNGVFSVANEDHPFLNPDDFKLETFPNPVVNRLEVHLTSGQDGQVHLELLDILGRQIRTEKASVVNGSKTTLNMDVSDLPAGLYFIRAVAQSTRFVSITVLR